VTLASIALVVAAVLALRVWIFRARRRRRAQAATSDPTTAVSPLRDLSARVGRGLGAFDGSFGDIGIVAGREIKERVRGRILRIGTLVILVVVAAAIIIPTLRSSSSPTLQTVGVVGAMSAPVGQILSAAAATNQDSVKLVLEPSLAVTKSELRLGTIDFAIVDNSAVLLDRPAGADGSHADPGLVQEVAEYLGVLKAYHEAGLSPTQITQVDAAKPVPVQALQPGSKAATKSASVIGLVLLFVMLTQYNTWILIGVMQEKSSRVVEVLLATLRPIQLLGGKVLGIGIVALSQATLIVAFALVVASAVGSDLLKGAAPLVLACQLLWLILGYAFYCWLYAAGGSTAERQDQVQTLVLPLSIPILVGYVFSITVASSGKPDLFFNVLAYLPPTAPFCMPVLVGMNKVTWWEFVISVVISLAGTVLMAIFAARIYRRAVLRSGARVKLRELLASVAR
jgi:ABC-2 type transport system permease protein